MLKTTIRWAAFAAAVALAAPAALAKLPPLSDEAKAKAEEAKAKTAWSDKVAAYQLCRSMDRVAARTLAQMKQAGKPVAEPVATPACADPGPFAYTPPESKPLEASGAHSPAATAATPPSTRTPAAEVPVAAARKP